MKPAVPLKQVVDGEPVPRRLQRKLGSPSSNRLLPYFVGFFPTVWQKEQDK
jgi:hypothetical protein